MTELVEAAEAACEHLTAHMRREELQVRPSPFRCRNGDTLQSTKHVCRRYQAATGHARACHEREGQSKRDPGPYVEEQ